MTAADETRAARLERSPAAALQLARVQLVYAGVILLIAAVFTLLQEGVWMRPSTIIAAVAIVGGTALAVLLDRPRLPRREWLDVAVPMLDLVGLLALISDPDVPRVMSMLAVVPAFWLGIAAQRRGIAIVIVAGLLAALTMTLSIPHSEGAMRLSNAIGVVLVPLALVAAAWFAHTFSRTIYLQQRALLERERERAALAKEREADARLLDAIFETARVGLLLLDRDGAIVRVNATLADHPALAGDHVSQMVSGVRFLELDTRRELPALESPFLRAARGEAFDNVDFWVARPDKEQFAITISSRPLLIDGEFRGSIASVDDITGYLRMVEDRDDFVALVSHELRTPLTSIAGYLELALDEELSPDVRSWLAIVQRNSDRLRALVEDLLAVGELGRGEVHLKTERVDLRALAADAVATLEHRARRRGVALTLDDGPALVIDADARRITQVIENLISNGIKYTRDDGAVEVRVEQAGSDACLRVVDNGNGMLPVEAARVFERFYRSKDARASGVQGAGLGLWICKMIVEEHGGTIDFQSEPGHGSVASFRLPAVG